MTRSTLAVLTTVVLGCNGHRSTTPSPSPGRDAGGDAAIDTGATVDAPMTWTPTDRRPDDHEFVAFPYLDRLVDDGVPCADTFALAPHDERIGESPHGSIAFRIGAFHRGCFSRNLFKGYLLDHRPALVACFHAATPGVAGAATIRTYWVPPDRYDEAPRLLARVEVLHARGARDFDVGVLQQCLQHALGDFRELSSDPALPAELDLALVFIEPPGPAAIGGGS
ncbi:MAG: hypothetical protein IPL61_34145 [Myxococcales bacterium]|nr:hypothetical protein [Myxococcales bacterium]